MYGISEESILLWHVRRSFRLQLCISLQRWTELTHLGFVSSGDQPEKLASSTAFNCSDLAWTLFLNTGFMDGEGKRPCYFTVTTFWRSGEKLIT